MQLLNWLSNLRFGRSTSRAIRGSRGLRRDQRIPASIALLEPRQLLAGVSTSSDYYQASHDQALIVNVSSGVLFNDEGWTDSGDGSNTYTLTAATATDPSNGSFALNSNGSFTYTPDAGYVGEDTFTYTASYGPASIDGTVTIAVTNYSPTVDQNYVSYGVTHDEVLVVTTPPVSVSDSDDTSLTVAQVDDVEHGTLDLNSDGTFVYTPDSGYAGPDDFSIKYVDPLGAESTVIEISIAVMNSAPEAVNDEGYFAIAGGSTFTYNAAIGVLHNDTDSESIDLPNLTATVVSTTTLGTLNLNSDGSFTYEVSAGALSSSQDSAVDTFTYTCSDGNDTSNTATVTINIGKLKITADDPNSFDATIDVTNQTRDTTDGMRNTVYSEISGQADGLTVSYSWTVVGNPIKDYNINENKVTELTAGDYTNAGLQWYWTTAEGVQYVTLSAEFKDANGTVVGTADAATQFDVTRPTASVSIQTGNVQLINSDVASFGNVATTPGIKATPTVGNTAGSFGWIQILNSSEANRTDANGDRYRANIYDAYDSRSTTSFRYDYNTDNGVFQDSPFETLLQQAVQQDRSDEFTTYLLFKPDSPGAIFVPLKVFHWSWSFSAVRDGNGNWVLAPDSDCSGVTDLSSYPPRAPRTVGNPPVRDWELVN